MQTPRPNPEPIDLQYATPLPPAKRPAWVWVVVGVYVTILLGIAALPELMAWSESGGDAMRYFFMTATAVCVLFALGGSLLVIPVRARRLRPITRRSIVIPLIGSILLFGILCAAAGIATMELLNPRNDNRYAPLLIAGFGVVWLAWTILFAFLARSLDPERLNSKLYQSLFVGSVLELLVAVPMHLVVRRRTECCAGMMTGTAICLGALVAVVALGPGVFFLYHRRWRETYGKNP